jgi:hypothetical protein
MVEKEAALYRIDKGAAPQIKRTDRSTDAVSIDNPHLSAQCTVLGLLSEEHFMSEQSLNSGFLFR